MSRAAFVASSFFTSSPSFSPQSRLSLCPTFPISQLQTPAFFRSLPSPAMTNESSNTPPPPPPSLSPLARLKAIFTANKAAKARTLRNYGVAAIISYGMFDALTYTISFLISLRAYVAAGKPLSWGTLPQVLALMWGINNLSRPFRIAGAVALAPLVDRKIVKPVAAFIQRLRHHDN